MGSTPRTHLDRVDGSIVLPVVLAIMVTSTLLLLGVWMFKRRRYLGLGRLVYSFVIFPNLHFRYAGYTQGSSEYSVKSLTEREAGGKDQMVRTPLFTHHSLSRQGKGEAIAGG